MAALPSINVSWTGGGATKSFTNAGGEQNWTYVSGGTGLLATGDYPGTGSTLQFLDSTKILPAANLPTSGNYAIVVRDDVDAGGYYAGWYQNLTDFLGAGAWNCLSLVAGGSPGAYTHDDTVIIDKDTVVGGTVENWAHVYIDSPLVNALITNKDGSLSAGTSTLDKVLVAEANSYVRVTAGGTLALNGTPASVLLAGVVSSTPGDPQVLDCATPIKVTATGASAVLGSGKLTIKGGFNADGYTVTWASLSGSTLICDVDGTLDLGADTALLDVEIAANVTLGRNLVCHTLTLTSGILSLNGYTITYDHLVYTDGTLFDGLFSDYVLKTAVAADANVLSGTPRWTGATGVGYIGPLPYTRKRGALR